MRYQFYENFLHRLMSVKIVYYVSTAIAVWSTLFIEIASPFLLWTRLRWLMIFLATAMHAVIGVLMGLNLFELLMIVMLLAFLPDRVIRDRFRGGWDLARLSMTFNPQKAVHARAAALALASDVDNQITLAPNPTATTVMLVDSDKKAVSGPAGVTTFFKEVRLPALLGLVLWIPGLRSLMSKFLFPDDTAMNRDIKTTASLTRSPAARG